MARRKRSEQAGASYHVMNRGIARRTIFDTRADFRFFLACLARAVRRGEIKVLAYALMRTHFHLFVRSLGGMSAAMRRVQQRHARRFNRLHRRDGPLFRGRFLACRVRGNRHTRNVVRYVHENPVVAQLCALPTEYEWSSAALMACDPRPRWFTDREVLQHGFAENRVAVASHEVMLARADLVEARIRAPKPTQEEPLDAATPERVLDWMQRKARLADGTITGLPEVGPQTLAQFMRDTTIAGTAGSVHVPGACTYPARELLIAGLLRDVSCCTYPEIATALGSNPARVKRLCRFHWRCLDLLPSYADLAAVIVSECIGVTQGP